MMMLQSFLVFQRIHYIDQQSYIMDRRLGAVHQRVRGIRSMPVVDISSSILILLYMAVSTTTVLGRVASAAVRSFTDLTLW